MWPYINLDDLTQLRLLLPLLNSRGRNLPCNFSHADFEAVHLGHVSGVIRPAFPNEYTMLLHGQTTPATYGKLVAWEDDDDAFDWLTSGLQFHPGMGLLVLQIQQELLQFLVQCCLAIFQDLPLEFLTDKSILVQPEPPTLLPNETAYPTLAALAADTPYRVPAHLDFRHLRSLAAARSSAANDHVYAMREDPGYFSGVVGEYSEYRQETLSDTNGNRHPVLKEDLFWDRVAGTAVADAYTSRSLWDVIHKRVVELEKLQQNYSGSISPRRKLPEEYQQALLNFDYLLENIPKILIGSLKVGVPPSPPLRSLFVREPQEANSTMIRVRTKRDDSSKDELIRVFRILWNDQQLFLYGLPNVMDELERLLESDREQKKRLSGWVRDFISDLALLAQMKNQLKLYQPWASTFENDAADEEEALKADYSKSISSVTDFARALKSVPSISRLVTPHRDKFHYPIDKPRTRQTTHSLCEAEKSLDSFWKFFDQHFVRACRSDVVKKLLPEQYHVQRAPEWVEPVKTESSANSNTEEELPDHFSSLSTDHEQSGFEAPPSKTKVKTRGQSQKTDSFGAAPPEPVPQRLVSDQQPLFVLGRRAYKVFSILFYVPNQTDTPGDVPRADFLHAMASTGFQIEKLYGSVWQFTPSKLDVENSIQFYEPHPSGKIPFRTARRHGRRLYRMYGWTGNMFAIG
jgi:hypothetical protein